MSGNPLKLLRAPGRAFTLVELLVVLATVALLACLCLPAFARVQGQTTRAQCAANLKQFDLALQIYGSDHSNFLTSCTPSKRASQATLRPGPLRR